MLGLQRLLYGSADIVSHRIKIGLVLHAPCKALQISGARLQTSGGWRRYARLLIPVEASAGRGACPLRSWKRQMLDAKAAGPYLAPVTLSIAWSFGRRPRNKSIDKPG